jgi:hypothetical protein
MRLAAGDHMTGFFLLAADVRCASHCADDETLDFPTPFAGCKVTNVSLMS